jgi:hypothetical protein
MLVILISTMHPDELALTADLTDADAVIWKGELVPRALDQLWRFQRLIVDHPPTDDRARNRPRADA